MQNGHHPPVLFLLVSALSLVLSLRGMEILSLESTTRKGTTFSFSRCWLLPMGGPNKLLQLFVAASFTRSTSERVCCCDRTRNQRKKKTFVSSFFFFFEHFFWGALSLIFFIFTSFISLLHFFCSYSSRTGWKERQTQFITADSVIIH